MPRLKLTQPGFETYTGPLHEVDFVNGVTPDISLDLIDRIAAIMSGNLVEADGTTVIGPAGEAARAVAAGVTMGAQPVRIAATAARIDVAKIAIRTISAATYTIAAADDGFLLDFAVACTVTVPTGLPEGFACALRQGGSGQITVAAGAGATVEEIDGKFKSEKRLALLTLTRFPNGSYQLSGRTAV